MTNPCSFAVALGGRGPVAPTPTGVQVLQMGSVGPYQYQVIAALPSDPSGTALFQWLTANNFSIPAGAQSIVGRYVALQHRFVTLKLSKSASVGSMVPIVIQWKSPSLDMSCVPLRLTAIAATDNMPIYVWIAGPLRAVPQNFIHIVPDLTQLSWLTCAQSFTPQIGGRFGPQTAQGAAPACTQEYFNLLLNTSAALGASKWITTDFAGAKPAGLLDAVWSLSSPQYSAADYYSFTSAKDFLNQLFNQLPTDLRQSPVLFALLQQYVPMTAAANDPNCNSQTVFYAPFSSCLTQYAQSFNAKPLADAIQTTLIQPLIDTRALLAAYPYLTRLFSLQSPADMLRDPVFRFVDSLPDVANVHNAVLAIECPSAPNAPASGVLTIDNATTTATIDGIMPSTCGAVTAPFAPVFTTSVAELLQLAANSVSTLNRTMLPSAGAVASADASLDAIDNISGPAITSACGMCNCGTRGCGCTPQGMCGAMLVCTASASGAKTCQMAPVSKSSDSNVHDVAFALGTAMLAAFTTAFF